MLNKDEVRIRGLRIRGLRILARRDALTETDWFNLLEARRALLELHLREMTLKTLGDLKIIYDDLNRGVGNGRPLRMGGMVEKFTKKDLPLHWVESTPVVEGNFSLDTRGIFPDDEAYYHGHFKWDFIRIPPRVEAVGQVTKFWGLTRNNQWILVEFPIRYRMVTYPALPGTCCKERTEKRSEVERVIVRESTPAEICQFCEITPQWIWQRLGDAAQAWVNHRRYLLSNAEQLVEVIKREETMLDITAPR